MTKPRVLLAALVGVVLATGVTVGVQAVAQGSNTTYFACLKGGKLTQVGTTSPTCYGSATVISWNSQGPSVPTGPPGPTGSEGPTGPQGKTGPAGMQGVSHAWFASNTGSGFTFADTAKHLVEHLLLPTGDYVVSAEVQITDVSGVGPSMACDLHSSDGSTDNFVFELAPFQSEDFPLNVRATSANAVSVQCQNETGTEYSVGASITAIQVSALN